MRWLSKNLINFSLASFFNDFCHEMTTAILPSFVAQLTGPELAPTFLGIIEGVSDAASTGMKLLSGWLADRVRFYKPILFIGYAATPIFVALLGVTHSVLFVLIFRTLAWMGRGLREPVRDTWISKMVSPQFYGRAFGLHRASDTLGAVCGPVAVSILLHYAFSLPSIFILSFIPGVISLIPIVLLTDPGFVFVRTSSKSTSASPGMLSLFPREFNYFLGVMFLFGLGNFHQVLLIYRVQEILPEHAATTGVLFYTLFNIVRACSELGMGYLSDFVNRKNLLAVFGFGLFGVTSLGFMLTSENIAVWIALFACAGVSVGTVKALEKAHAATLLPEHIRGTGLGTLQALDGIGDLISSALVGMLWSFYSPTVGLGYSAVLSGLSMVILLALNRRTRLASK